MTRRLLTETGPEAVTKWGDFFLKKRWSLNVLQRSLAESFESEDGCAGTIIFLEGRGICW
jgi:hypothetical protein